MIKTPLHFNKELAAELEATTANMTKVARAFGMNFQTLGTRFGADGLQFKTAVGAEPADIRTLGRPRLQRFVVAVKRAGQGWPERYRDPIRRAQHLYDKGSHEMATGVRDGWVILYSIPRAKNVAPRTYFSQRG